MKGSFYIALLVIFIDLVGVGLVYPLFSTMLFDGNSPLLPAATSYEMRGLWLGILLSLMPLTQFFSAPIWGALSDSKGRKKPLLISLGVGLCGYLVALGGIVLGNFFLLLSSRIIIGFGAGNTSIVQATIADLSSPADKAKNFGLYSMALGTGFTLGPFFGGGLAKWGYFFPFLFATIIVGLNIVFAFIFFKETNRNLFKRKLSWTVGFNNLKKAFRFKELRTILVCYFIHCFGWTFFFEFLPVYLMQRFQVSPSGLGMFYGLFGAFYALSTGVLIRPLVRRLKPETLFFGGNFLTAFVILSFLLLPTSFWLWPISFLLAYFVGFVSPTATALVSNHAPDEVQGEALGVLSSVNAAGIVLSSLFSGSFVGAYPSVSIWVGGLLMLATSLIILVVLRQRLFRKRL